VHGENSDTFRLRQREFLNTDPEQNQH